MPNISGQSYRRDIDGIRAVAILSVLLYHVHAPFFTGGFTGVDIFFVISGYLIGGHIYSEFMAGDFSFLRFYQRRAKRILPAFYVVVLFTIAAAVCLLSPSEATSLGGFAFAAILSASNLVLGRHSGYFEPRSELNPLLMTWSLGVEEQFYAVIPLLMGLLVRLRRNWLLPAILTLCILSLLLSIVELRSHPTIVFYMLPTRAWELGAGVALTIAETNRRRSSAGGAAVEAMSVAGAVLMLAPMFILNANSTFPGLAALPTIVGASLLIATPASLINRRCLSIKPLVFVGKISYSLYLWHWPILSLLRSESGAELSAGATLVAIAISFAAAILSYYFVEQPFRGSTRSPGSLLVRYAVVSALVLALCAALWLGGGARRLNPNLARLEKEATVLTVYGCLVSNGELPAKKACYDTSDPRPSVALWGDSHSAALAPGFRSAASAQGFGFVQLGRTSCLPLIGVSRSTPPGGALSAKECLAFNRKALDLLATDRKVQTVVLAGAWMTALQHSTDQWLTSESAGRLITPTSAELETILTGSLAATIQSLRQAGKQVIVVEDVPSYDFDPLIRFRISHNPARQAVAAWLGAPNATDSGVAPEAEAAASRMVNAQLSSVVSGVRGVELIDLKPALCRGDGQCMYRNGDLLFYFDPEHLTSAGAAFALRDFRFPALVDPAKFPGQ